MTQQVNTRKFSVSPHIIYSLIKAQAGTLAKGILECVMNSVDAGAQSIDIVVKAGTLLVSDNGKGFETRADIEACFEVFGFEHKEGDRTYGQFGIGRAQLWNFCSTVWHTNEFRMDVDIKNKGLDYDLVEGAEPFKGLRIEGKFYEPLTSSEILACERELKELATYVNVPVTFNGERISKDPSTQKWTHETDDAWIQVNNVSNNLVVYNLGVKVREYPSHYFGMGGLVVTKPGVRLSLNMARNDILLAECKVWKRIKPFLQKKSDETVKRASRLTEEQMTNMCTRFIAGELEYEDVVSRKVIQDVLGKKYTLEEFYDKAFRTTDKTVTYVPRGEAVPTAEEAHKRGDCMVLAYQTLQRFSVRSLTEMMEKLAKAVAEAAPADYPRICRAYPPSWHGRAQAEKLSIVENWREACKRVREGYTEVAHKDWTKREMAAIAALSSRGYGYFPWLLKSAGVVETEVVQREFRIGISEVAEAWTDGAKTVTLNRELLARMDQGFSGVMHVVAVLVHEFLHEGPSTDTHVHDEEFYDRFHRVMTYFPRNGNYGMTVGDIASSVLSSYLKECSKRGVPIKAKVVQAVDKLEAFAISE